MNWALEALGLPHDADERMVKRAYAQRLRTVRPDTDPEGFQALHEAYQAALEAIQRRATAAAPALHWHTSTVGMARFEDNGSIVSSRTIDDDSDSMADENNDTEQIDGDGIDRVDMAVINTEAIEADTVDAETFGIDATDLNALDIDTIDIEESETAQWVPNRSFGPPPLPRAQDTASPAFDDPIMLADACIAQAMTLDLAALSAWLQSKPEFWSLPLKARTAQMMYAALDARAPPMPAQNLSHLLAFFGFDDIGSGIDPYRIDRIQRRTLQAWLLRAPMRGVHGHRMSAELERPYRPWESVLRGMIPGRPASIGRLLAALKIDGFNTLPAHVDLKQVAFWQAASNPARISWQRFAIDFGRIALIAIFVAILVTVAGIGISQANGTALALPTHAWLFLLAPIGVSFAYTIARSYIAWYPTDGWRHGLVFATLMPLLACTAWWLDNGLEHIGAAIAVNTLALVLTAARWTRHAIKGGLTYSFQWWHVLVAIPTLKVCGLIAVAMVAIVEVGAIAVLLAWSIEAVIFVIALYHSRR